MKKLSRTLFSLFLLLLTSLGLVSAGVMKCHFNLDSCASNEVPFFYANHNFEDSFGEVLSSNVKTSVLDSNYNLPLCCYLDSTDIATNLQVSIEDYDQTENGKKCSNGGQDILYFTNNTNARVAFYKYDDGETNPLFVNDDYSQKLCLNVPDEFTELNIKIANDSKNYGLLQGYECLFKISNITNGVVSSCDATFNSGDKYHYTVWGKLWENIASLKCNIDCTSKLDNRVYSACSQKIRECYGVPSACDGSLYGAWVNSSAGYEVKCAAPWTIKRVAAFTQIPVKIETNEQTCPTLIKKSYQVLVNNELINMNVYVCGGGE